MDIINNIINKITADKISTTYFTSLTIILILLIIFGVNLLKKITKEKFLLFIYVLFLIILWILFQCIYFLNWNVENIFILGIILFTFIFTILGIILFYYNTFEKNIEEDQKNESHVLAKILFFSLYILLIYIITKNTLSSENNWTLYNTVLFILSLLLLRILYYIEYSYISIGYYKTLVDILMVVLFFISFKNIYISYKNNSSSTQPQPQP